MKETEYANRLIEDCECKFSYMVEFGDTKKVAIELAIQDVENTIEALDKTVSGIGWGSAQFPNPKIPYYQKVLQILKDKL